MTEVIVLVVVSVVLWAVVAYAYWYSIKKTYGMRAERAKEDTPSPKVGSNSPESESR
jgi:flagellar basal body-associated protein FliL